MRYQAEAKRERVEIAHDYYQSGVRAFLERDWDRARQNFVLLEAYDPGHSRANVYRRAIQRERKVETALEEVRAARDRGDLAHGLALLRELPPTVLFEQDVGGLKRALDAEVDSLIARSRADAQAGKWSRVVGSTGVLLAARPKTTAFMALRSHARSLAPTGADEVASPPDSDSAATKVDPEKPTVPALKLFTRGAISTRRSIILD